MAEWCMAGKRCTWGAWSHPHAVGGSTVRRWEPAAYDGLVDAAQVRLAGARSYQERQVARRRASKRMLQRCWCQRQLMVNGHPSSIAPWPSAPPAARSGEGPHRAIFQAAMRLSSSTCRMRIPHPEGCPRQLQSTSMLAHSSHKLACHRHDNIEPAPAQTSCFRRLCDVQTASAADENDACSK